MSVEYTILVASRNRSQNITNLLESLEQNGIFGRVDLEVLIVDNSSGDAALENICKKYGVKCIPERKKGKANALNTGVLNAEGQYVLFTDDDVIITDPNWPDKLAKHFREIPNLGYVSGNVIARKIQTTAQQKWEKKGGLSKGAEPKHFNREFLDQFRVLPWPLTKICAGANCMIPTKVLNEVGGFCSLFGPGGMIGHGESLLIGYEIIRKGYELYYDPKVTVLHDHPEERDAIKNKLFLYGTGDTALHMYLFTRYGDKRSLFWAIGGHQAYVTKNMLKWFSGDYALPPNYTIHSLRGSAFGPIKFLVEYYLKGGKKDENYLCDGK